MTGKLVVSAAVLIRLASCGRRCCRRAAVAAGVLPNGIGRVAWSVYDTSRTIECGAVDGRSILGQLQAGHLREIVLCFAGPE